MDPREMSRRIRIFMEIIENFDRLFTQAPARRRRRLNEDGESADDR